MQMCDAKTFLKQVKTYDTRIDFKLEEAARLRVLATKITATLKDVVVSGGGSQDKVGDGASKIVDLEREIDTIIDTYIDLKKAVNDVVEELENPDEAAVLYKRYFLYERWEQIAMEMNMSHRNVTRLHGRALQSVNELLKSKCCP